MKKVHSSFKFYITYQKVVKKMSKLRKNFLNAKVRCTSLSEQCPIIFRKYVKPIYLYNFSQYFVKIFPSTSINWSTQRPHTREEVDTLKVRQKKNDEKKNSRNYKNETLLMSTSSQAATSLSLSSLNFCSSWNSSIMVSIRFMCDFTMLLSVVGDNSYKAHIHIKTHTWVIYSASISVNSRSFSYSRLVKLRTQRRGLL